MLKNIKRFIIKKASTNRQAVNHFYAKAAEKCNVPKNMIDHLKTPHAILKMNIPLIRDDGTFSTITGYRCHHKMHKLPLKGGIMISPKMSIENLENGALEKSLQLAYMEIPFGGSKGGLKFNPKRFSKSEIERIIRRFTIELVKYKFIGSGVDVAAPEKGTTSWHMDLMKDTY